MLKPQVVAAGVGRNGATGALDKFDLFLAEVEFEPGGCFGVAGDKGKRADVEGESAIEPRYRYHDMIDGIGRRGCVSKRRSEQQPADEGDGADHYSQLRPPSRSSRWSPTRSALAMMVRVGLTAALDGKKLPSTTYKLSTSCVRQLRSSADVVGSPPKRIVPF